MSILSNGNVLLRAVEPEDADVIFEWENNTDNWSVSNTLVPFSYHTITQYALNASQDIFEARQLRLIIVDIASNAVVGAVDFCIRSSCIWELVQVIRVASNCLKNQGLSFVVFVRLGCELRRGGRMSIFISASTSNCSQEWYLRPLFFCFRSRSEMRSVEARLLLEEMEFLGLGYTYRLGLRCFVLVLCLGLYIRQSFWVFLNWYKPQYRICGSFCSF